jgi:hypothetical protein
MNHTRSEQSEPRRDLSVRGWATDAIDTTPHSLDALVNVLLTHPAARKGKSNHDEINRRIRRDKDLKSQWTQLADTIGQTCLDILGEKPVTVTEKRFADPRVLAIMLASRALSNFRGVFTLIENNLTLS